MTKEWSRRSGGAVCAVLVGVCLLCASDPALAQSPFQTGATSFVTNFIAIATPIAIIFVMALGIAALVGRISWSWPIGAVFGIGILFGAPQIVTWVRGMFAV